MSKKPVKRGPMDIFLGNSTPPAQNKKSKQEYEGKWVRTLICYWLEEF